MADAVVLTLFNFLPVPPLDGGRAVIGAHDALNFAIGMQAATAEPRAM